MIFAAILNPSLAFYLKVVILQIVLAVCLINVKLYNMNKAPIAVVQKPRFEFLLVSEETSARLQRAQAFHQLRQACDNANHSHHGDLSSVILPPKLPKFYTALQYNLTFCVAPKVASTFWIHAFDLLNNGEDETQKSDSFIDAARGMGDESSDPFAAVSGNVQGVSAMMVRNPYSRLFSTYLDKVYVPALVWSQQGKTQLEAIIQHAAKLRGLKKRSIQRRHVCDWLITFEEFLDYVGSHPTTPDKHWAPVSALCRPCTTSLSLVLKMEDFAMGTKQLLEDAKVETTKRELIMEALERNKTNLVEKTIDSMFTMRKLHAKKCLSDYEFAHRIWKMLKLQGFIHTSLEFSRSLFKNNERITSTRLIQLATNAMTSPSLTSKEARQQQREELNKAYATVSEAVLQKVRQVYHHDFKLFSYDREIPE